MALINIYDEAGTGFDMSGLTDGYGVFVTAGEDPYYLGTYSYDYDTDYDLYEYRDGSSFSVFYGYVISGILIESIYHYNYFSDPVLGMYGINVFVSNDDLYNLSYVWELVFMNGDDEITGNRYGDIAKGGDGNDTIRGLGGNDRLYGERGADFLNGGAGNDYANGGSHADFIIGEGGDDLLEGGGGYDRLYGDDGNDTVRGGPDGDLIYGGRDNDKLYGDAGDDQIYGESGNDRLYGSLDKDSLYGGDGNDFLDGGAGADRMLGGNGNDIYIVDNQNDVVVESSRAGVDTVRSTTELRLSANVDNLLLKGSRDIDGTGNALSNVIRGNAGDNTLSGLDGNDLLDGGAGNDRLIGGDDRDRLLGGAGRDVMSGDEGEDRFLFRSVSDSKVGSQRDVVTDFDTLEDQIDLRSIDANSRSGGNQEFDFIGTSGFHGAAGEVRFSGGILAGDVNGDRVADFEVELTGVSSLVEDHFIL